MHYIPPELPWRSTPIKNRSETSTCICVPRSYSSTGLHDKMITGIHFKRYKKSIKSKSIFRKMSYKWSRGLRFIPRRIYLQTCRKNSSEEVHKLLIDSRTKAVTTTKQNKSYEDKGPAVLRKTVLYLHGDYKQTIEQHYNWENIQSCGDGTKLGSAQVKDANEITLQYFMKKEPFCF